MKRSMKGSISTGFAKYKLMNGLDDIGLTLQHEDKIAGVRVCQGTMRG